MVRIRPWSMGSVGSFLVLMLALVCCMPAKDFRDEICPDTWCCHASTARIKSSWLGQFHTSMLASAWSTKESNMFHCQCSWCILCRSRWLGPGLGWMREHCAASVKIGATESTVVYFLVSESVFHMAWNVGSAIGWLTMEKCRRGEAPGLCSPKALSAVGVSPSKCACIRRGYAMQQVRPGHCFDGKKLAFIGSFGKGQCLPFGENFFNFLSDNRVGHLF